MRVEAGNVGKVWLCQSDSQRKVFIKKRKGLYSEKNLPKCQQLASQTYVLKGWNDLRDPKTERERKPNKLKA